MSEIHIDIKGTGKPLVFFHGWGFDHRIWLSLVPLLINQYQLYLVDLPGFGLTPNMPWERFKTALLDVLTEEFALAGWSMGGLLATRLALEAPQRVTHLVNIASSPCFIRKNQWPGVDVAVFNTFFDSLVTDPNKTLTDFIKLQLNNETAFVPTEKTASYKGLNEGLEMLATWDLRDKLFQLQMPVCYMFGRLDAITSSKTMECMQHAYPYLHYVLFKKAAHVPFLSHKELFISTLTEFLK